MHRFFENIRLNIMDVILLNHDNSYKIINVLKLKVNQELCLFNNTNFEFQGKIIEISNKKVLVKIINSINNDLESNLKIHLVQAIPKNDNMDLIIQKSIELGVEQITPIISERTIVKPKNYFNKIEHWKAIAIGACCQCGRNIIPNINPIVTFKDFIKINTHNIEQKSTNIGSHTKCLQLIMTPFMATDMTAKLNAYRYHNSSALLTLAVTEQQIKYEKIYIVIGPEGGFSINELNIATQNGFLLVDLGPRILRTETASITIMSILQANFGDLLKYSNNYKINNK